MKVIAHITPQAWIGGHAVEIDAPGDLEWDATVAFEALPEWYRRQLTATTRVDEWALDHLDYLMNDLRHAPDWVAKHSGPFDIFLRFEDAA